MSRLRKVVLHPVNPVRRPTEEELKESDKHWDMLYKGKSVCITDPSKSGTPDEIIEVLKDPKKESALCIDCPGGLSYEEFYKRLMNGEYDEA